MQRLLMTALKQWKDRPSRMPLILRGARQVGKTTLLEQFCKDHFQQTLSINFELQPEYIKAFDDLAPTKIINTLQALNQNIRLTPDTILFLDEIQECPNAIRSLRYFKEQMPEIPIVSAGSLLEFVLRQEQFRMPVGRIESLYLKPMTFEEFLLADGYEQLLDCLKEATPSKLPNPAIAEKAESLLREYFVIGGMPNVMINYIANRNLQETQLLQAGIMDTYRRDFGKYCRGNKINYIQKLFEKAPGMVSERFRYINVDENMQSRELKIALTDLTDAGLVHPIYHSSASGIPLNANINEKKFKVLFLDIGLVKFVSQLDAQLMLNKDLMLINKGALAEQFVGQSLLCREPYYSPQQLFYWEREKRGSMAEVDYLLSVNETIFPIEVKAGKTGSLRSLKVFMDEKKTPFGVRISMHPLSYKNNVLSVPLYMISELERLIRYVLCK